jgi:hypothetical protein
MVAFVCTYLQSSINSGAGVDEDKAMSDIFIRLISFSP